MRFSFFIFFLVWGCSSDKKLRSTEVALRDNDERLSFDWDGDGSPEVVTIGSVRGPGEYRELVITEGAPEGERSKRLLINRNLIPRKARPGASIRLQRDKSFVLTVDSSESGRASEVLVWRVQWRKKRFLVTGLTREWTDKLDPRDHRSCVVNLLEGRGKRNGKPVKFPSLLVELNDLNAKFLPDVCDF